MQFTKQFNLNYWLISTLSNIYMIISMEVPAFVFVWKKIWQLVEWKIEQKCSLFSLRIALKRQLKLVCPYLLCRFFCHNSLKIYTIKALEYVFLVRFECSIKFVINRKFLTFCFVFPQGLTENNWRNLYFLSATLRFSVTQPFHWSDGPILHLPQGLGSME